MRVWMRALGDELADCELTFLEREPLDLARARAQHAELARILAQLGCEVELLPALSGYPDAPFVEDTALLLGRVAVLGRPGAASRQGEVAAMAEILAARHELLELPETATLEGGDVLRLGDVLYVGQSSRTNHPGLKALAHLVLTEGLRVKAVEVRGCLHLETGACALDDERVLVNAAWVDTQRFTGHPLLEVHPDEPFGANVLRLGRRIVASASAPRTNESLRAAGYEVHEVELTELHKAEAGVTCLTLCDRGAAAEFNG